MFDSLWPHGQYSPWNSPGQNTRVGSLSLLQGVFPTQGSNPGLPHCMWILYQLSHKGSPKTLIPSDKQEYFITSVWSLAWIRRWQPTPGLLSGDSLGQRSLLGYSPWGHRVGHDWMTHTHTWSLTTDPSGNAGGWVQRKSSRYNPQDILPRM